MRVITNGFDLIHQAMNKLEYHNMKYLNNNHIFVFILTAVAKLLLHYSIYTTVLHYQNTFDQCVDYK